MYKIIICLVMCVFMLSGCGSVSEYKDLVTEFKDAEYLDLSNYVLSEYEDANISFELNMGDDKVVNLSEITNIVQVEASLIDLDSSSYKSYQGFNHFRYNVVLKSTDGKYGFSLLSKELYWEFIDNENQIVDLKVYTSNDEVECIVVNDKYLFVSTFDMYFY